MNSIDKYLLLLKSNKADTRYDACEGLRVAKESSPEVISALEAATRDEDKYVADRAKQALGAEVHQQMADKVKKGLPIVKEPDWSDRPLTDALNPGDTMFAVGKVRRRLSGSLGSLGSTGLLVRTGDGSYFVVDEDTPGKTDIRGAIHKTYPLSVGKTSYYYVGLLTDSIVIYFWPVDLYPEKLPKVMLFQKISADFLLNRIKELEELEILQRCPVCHLLRPVDVPECSNPECAARLTDVVKSTQSARAAQGSCLIGGGGGFLAGLLLLGIIYVVAWIYHAPVEYIDKMREYWWILPVILAVVGYLGLFIYLEKSIQKDSSQA